MKRRLYHESRTSRGCHVCLRLSAIPWPARLRCPGQYQLRCFAGCTKPWYGDGRGGRWPVLLWSDVRLRRNQSRARRSAEILRVLTSAGSSLWTKQTFGMLSSFQTGNTPISDFRRAFLISPECWPPLTISKGVNVNLRISWSLQRLFDVYYPLLDYVQKPQWPRDHRILSEGLGRPVAARRVVWRGLADQVLWSEQRREGNRRCGPRVQLGLKGRR